MVGQPNDFYYQSRDADHAVQVDPHELRRSGEMHRRWLFGVLAELDRLISDSGVRFWVTWELNVLDDRFRDAVAVVYDDDQLQMPLWAPAVPIIFKTVGLGRESLGWTARLPAPIAWRMALRDVRNAALERQRAWSGSPLAGPRPPIFQLPLGVSALVEVEPIPFSERPTDLFFAGSGEAEGRFTVRSKVVARREMERALDVIRHEQPDVSIDYRVFAPFGVHHGQDARILTTDQYVGRMAAARYALCPRGNVEETYRLFEAARLGCVAISEPLPPRWYFADCPYVRLRRWSQLPDVIRELRRDEAAAAEIAGAAAAWWQERIAEPRVAAFMGERLREAGIVAAAPTASGAR